MAGPETEKNPPTKSRPGAISGAQSELIWTAKQYGYLYRCWTMPTLGSPAQAFPQETRASIKASALVLIVILTFAIRPDLDFSGANMSYSVISVGLAVILSIVLAFINTAFRAHITDGELISAYGSIILLMLFFLIAQLYGPNFRLFELVVDYLTSENSSARSYRSAGLLIASAATYIAWIGKTLISDRKLPTLRSLGLSIVTVALAAGVVFCISYVSADLFAIFLNKQ